MRRNRPAGSASGTLVTDLNPLRGMPIISLNLSGTRVKDLSPLSGMRLSYLVLNGTEVNDLSPLADITTLQNIVLPPNEKNIEIIRRLPNIRQIGFTSDTRKPPDQFWAEYDRKQSEAGTQPAPNN